MTGFSTAVFLFFQKEASSYQLKLREKDNSFRIISAVIESMKYWREHAQKTVLLFEILGRCTTSKILQLYHLDNHFEQLLGIPRDS